MGISKRDSDLKVSKRGQITIFIIIGIVLLLTVALFLFISNISVKRLPTKVAVEEIPTELDPVRAYVQDCLKETLIDGFKLLGIQGGYINPEKYGIMTNIENPTDSNAVSFLPGDPNSPLIPYWVHFSSRNTCIKDCQCDSEQPPLCKQGRKDCFSTGPNSIEEQLENYIIDSLDNCIRDFAPLIQQGFEITEKSEPVPAVTITRNNVQVYLQYPLQTRKADTKQTIPDFYVEIPFNFMTIYEFASQITRAETEFNFLEHWTMELINSFGGFDAPLPKSSASVFEPGSSESWSASTAKQTIINNILVPYIHSFRVYDTKNYENLVFPNNPFRTNFYRKRDLAIGSDQGFDYGNINANFFYFPTWPIHFDIKGRGVSGDYIGAEEGSVFELFISMVGLKRYQYGYDISYPIIVELNEDSQQAKNLFGQGGYEFFFALESNVRENRALNCSGTGPERVLFPTGALLCNRAHFQGNYIIETKDTFGNSLDGVQLIYTCGGQTSCNVGYTELDINSSSPYYNRTILKTNLPYPCAGGYIVARKQDYASVSQIYSTTSEKNDTIVLELEPLRTVTARVVKKRIVKSFAGWTPAGFGYLLSNEKVQINLEKIKHNPAEEDFFVSISLNGTVSEQEIKLYPGKYKISGVLIYNLPAPDRNSIVFADERVCVDEDLLTGGCEEYQTLHVDPFTETFYEGGVELDNVEIPASYLDNYDTLYFKVVSVPDSSSFNLLSFSDMKQMGKSDDWSQTLADELAPTPTVFTYDYTATDQDNNPMWGLTLS